VAKTSVGANKLVGAGHQKKSVWGDVMIGAALGPVFSTCSPTYFVILATVLPASFLLGTVYLLAYILGLVLVLALIAVLGQKLIDKLMKASSGESWVKRGAGLLFLIVGLAIIFGLDKQIETKILDTGYLDISRFEQRLLDQAQMPDPEPETSDLQTSNNEIMALSSEVKIPSHLKRSFSDTDFSKANPDLSGALSGGPTKDGIPALTNPEFIPLSEADYPDSVQAIVLKSDTETRVYPYNILTWHEIVNDTFDGTPVAVTFCPLCGSAIVYNRTLPDGSITTFGVSGSLLESNMIMYDRATENLWQQSTGETLAGSFFPATLKLEPFQLMTLGEVRATFKDAKVMSRETGHRRNYDRNPYSGYETDNTFAFEPSNIDTTFSPKEIMVVFKDANDTRTAVPWLKLREAGGATNTTGGLTYQLSVTETGELTITDEGGTIYPFYFEMWFSFAVQHGERSAIITP
jgi:hypothetical protein